MRMSAGLAAAPAMSPDALEELVVANIGLVKALAWRVAQRLPSHVEVDELVSVGMMGLVDAARRYQPSLKVPFDAFVRRRIQGAMLDSLRELDWTPRSVRKLRRDIEARMAELRTQLNREPTEQEISSALDMSVDEYRKALEQIRTADLAQVRQLETGPDGTPLLDVAMDADGPHALLERSEMKELLKQAISDLSERERQILSLYYEHECTLAEIGQVLGVGESRVSQLRTQAISRLRARMRDPIQRKADAR